MKSIELKSKIINDKYTEYVYETFDIQNREETSVSIPLNFEELKKTEWNIGVIYGSSGSGKSSIIKKMGGVKEVSFDKERALISCFDWLEPSEASFVLTSMGLSSVPTWLRPFHTLSNGEQYRAILAYIVSSAKDGEVILVDEYTSVVDRDVAKAMSFALQKYIRRENKRIILASCHYDIMEWLMPDWTYSLQKGGVLERNDYLRQGRPNIELSVSRCKIDTWDMFKKHHYLTEDVNKAFSCLLFEWKNVPVGIVIYKPQASGSLPNGYGLSRTVVLPDFQGMGIGSKISEFVSAILKSKDLRIFTKTINPALGIYREKNKDKWRPTSKNKIVRKDIESDKKVKTRLSRASYCYEYIGEAIYGYEDILLPIKNYL